MPPGGSCAISASDRMSDLGTELQQPEFEFLETHISWVFLGPHEVFKVKRPVDFGFLDFTTIEKRRKACDAEVRLNRRLAPDVYLGVVPVTADRSGRHGFGGTGDPVDWAVHMKRLPDAQRADVLCREGALQVSDVKRLADLLVTFHGDARCDEETSQYGEIDSIRRNIEENFEQTRSTLASYLNVEQAKEIEQWQVEFLKKTEIFQARVKERRIRDGHGDLRLEHVYFLAEERLAILDCIEFNDRFRYADVCSDIAFVSMDLAWHGRADLAEVFLGRYASEANDFDLYSVVNFYESYRAFVRGKIASFVARDLALSSEVRERAAEDARRYFLLALAFERPPLVPAAIVAVGGLIGSGKTTVAEALADELGAPAVSTDRTRKHLLGLGPRDSVESRAWSGAYDPTFSDAVYAEVLRRARVVLESGRPVIIDGSFRSRESRTEARKLAESLGVSFLMVECKPDIEVCRRRLKERERRERQVSDARSWLLDDFAVGFEPMDELPKGEHVVIDTGRGLEDSLAELRQVLRPYV